MAVEKNNLLFTNKIRAALEDKLTKESFSKVFVLVDENTQKQCLPIIENSLTDNYQIICITPGEKNKTLATSELIWQELTNGKADRHALLINLGGGVICDMGGFCARTYKRGINFWNIPTTLLSQIDASIGGKLGVDFGVFKNHIGLFSEPDLVLLDSIFFNTLPQDELISGYAEMVKHGLISDRAMFEELNNQNILEINWQNWVSRSVALKRDIVEQDAKENGLRKILNFGHTIGHAVESYYLDKINSLKHGEAIAIGMIAETYLSATKNMLSKNDSEKIIQYLMDVFPQQEIAEEAINVIVELASQDKKNKNDKIQTVLLKAIGKAIYDIEITGDDIRKSLHFYNQQVK